MTPNPSASPVIEVRNLSHRFGAPGAGGLQTVSFSIEPGQSLAVAGASGSGKTTLARLIMRLVPPDSGSIHLSGQDITRLRGESLRRLRPQFQMVFQDALAAFNPRASIGRILQDPLRIQGMSEKDHEGLVAAALERVGLDARFAQRLPEALSGGQRQRVAIARAMLAKPRLIVLDEPVSALDVSVRAQILNLLLDLQEESGIAYLFISHDLAVVHAFASRMIVLDEGRVVESGETAAILAAPQAKATRALVDAVPRLER